MVRALNANWLAAVVYQTVYTRGMTKYFYCSNYIGNQFIMAKQAPWEFVVYGQYTTAKGCVQALRIALCVRIALSRGILAIYHTNSCLIA
jgi:hypothetical protein